MAAMNLDEFFRASSTLNPKLTLLISEGQHFLPVNQLLIDKNSLLLGKSSPSQGGFATITLDQFMTRTKRLSLKTDLRTLNDRQLIFGFRIVNKSIVFY
ncbi:hypothetical protein FC79_GL001551 [Lentilactobacillus buchneri DSM 20057]|nr:hypothetical protein FC79_GL001551 [Lentilactobacillus buchneri DSM 20057]